MILWGPIGPYRPRFWASNDIKSDVLSAVERACFIAQSMATNIPSTLAALKNVLRP